MNEYDIEAAFRVIENELMASMIRNIKRHRIDEVKEEKEWVMWQAEQLKALEEYKRQNKERFKSRFGNINSSVVEIIHAARQQGSMEQEIKILRAIQRGYEPRIMPQRVNDYLSQFKGSNLKEAVAILLKRNIISTTSGEFFKMNTRKLEALIKATQSDFQKAETSILRMADDQYRKALFNAQVYANTGAGTYEQAVDMATKDYLSRGINCIEYANGARYTVASYAAMAIQTASKRAYLTGEGDKRQEWGISTVTMNKRGNACPKCLPFVGKILIDDVWSGGKQTDGPYMLMSAAIAAGLYHPNCKDSHTTYFEGISSPGATYTKEELEQVVNGFRSEQRQQCARNQAGKFERLAKYSLDENNKQKYETKYKEWNTIAKSAERDILVEKNTREVVPVQSIGKINREIYNCVTDDIITDEVIITDRQIQHIKDRHPNDYERFQNYFIEIVENPNYIIEANKPNTALILKEIEKDGEVFKTVLRLATSKDNVNYKNSIITFMKIDEKEWNRLLRNKKILYKAE